MGKHRHSPKIGPVEIAVTASVVVHVVLALIALPAMMKAASAMAAIPAKDTAIGQQFDSEKSEADEMPVALEIELPQFVQMVAREELRDSLIDYLRTTQNEATEVPENPAFQSDRNTQAASELPPDADADVPLPSQRGVDIPVVELATREYVDGEIADDRSLGNHAPELAAAALAQPAQPALAAANPQPSPLAAQEEAAGEETSEADEDEKFAEDASPAVPEEEFAQNPNSDQIIATVEQPQTIYDQPRETEINDAPSERTRPRQGALDTPREVYDPLAAHRPPSPVSPALRPGTDSAAPDIFQPQTRQNELRGTISNRGTAAADAVDTPMGRYMRKVTSAIEKEWNRKRIAKSDFVTYGNIRLTFFVDRTGKVKDLRIANPEKANPVMQDFSLSAVLEAPIPPIPKNLLSDLTGDRLPVTYDIIIY
ncbi:MAG: hypothetical protein ACI9R3_001314 [Verrucomicrobiales bacterium]|jgi:hypothetical protein